MTPKSEPVWVLGGIKKTILRKKPENSNPLIIYNTLSMSTPPKTLPFWLLKSYKIKEKKDPEHDPQKTLNIRSIYFFLQFRLPKWVTQGGVEQVPFSTCFRVLGRFGHPWGPPPQNGAKGLIKGAQSSLWRILFEANWCRFLMILGGFWNSFLMIFNAMCIVFYVAQNWKMPMADQGTVAGRPKASGYLCFCNSVMQLSLGTLRNPWQPAKNRMTSINKHEVA